METRFDEPTKQHFRKILFPIIGKEIITGYNLYYNRFRSKSPYVVTYFHSDLAPEDRHFTELVQILRNNCNPTLVENINNSVIARVATYKVGDWKENPENLKFFDLNGNEIIDIDDYEGTIIVEGKQYELNLEVENRKELRDLLKILKRTVSRYKLDKYGRVIEREGRFSENKKPISNVWYIPLIVLEGILGRRDFLRCTEISIKGKGHEATTLIRKQRKKLEDQLVGFAYNKANKYVNRLFIEQYLDV